VSRLVGSEMCIRDSSYANCKRPQWVDDEICGLYDKITMAEYQKSALIETSTGVTNASI
jgi:hypothetical protein